MLIVGRRLVIGFVGTTVGDRIRRNDDGSRVRRRRTRAIVFTGGYLDAQTEAEISDPDAIRPTRCADDGCARERVDVAALPLEGEGRRVPRPRALAGRELLSDACLAGDGRPRGVRAVGVAPQPEIPVLGRTVRPGAVLCGQRLADARCARDRGRLDVHRRHLRCSRRGCVEHQHSERRSSQKARDRGAQSIAEQTLDRT